MKRIVIRAWKESDAKSGVEFSVYLNKDFKWVPNLENAWFLDASEDITQVFRVYDGIKMDVGEENTGVRDPRLVEVELTERNLSTSDVRQLRRTKVLLSMSAEDREALDIE